MESTGIRKREFFSKIWARLISRWQFIVILLELIRADWLFKRSQPGRLTKSKLTSVLVAPIEEMLMRWAGGSVWRGGPQPPSGKTCLAVDHFRGKERISDRAKGCYDCENWPEVRDTLFWCGPLSDHFGHQIGEFGSRVIISSLDSRNGKLLFLHSEQGANWNSLLDWQKEWITYMNPRNKPVIISNGRFKALRMIIVPQQQRLGQQPTAQHLLALTFRQRQLNGPLIKEVVVISRSKHSPSQDPKTMKGSFAAEREFDQLMAEKGAHIIHPETIPFYKQLEILHRAQTLVVSEGSVLHAMEMLGYQPQKTVVVIARRPKWPNMEKPLKCRFPCITYVDAVEEIWWEPPSNPRVKGLANLNWHEALAQIGNAVGWEFSSQEANRLECAAERQIAGIRRIQSICSKRCGTESRKPQNSGGW